MAAVDQLALYGNEPAPAKPRVLPARPVTRVCAGCRAKEARYGFKDERHSVYRNGSAPFLERPRTLCFECFRMELTRRQTIAARLSRGWDAEQASLPLSDLLESAGRRRRQAQIAARHALGL